MCANYYFMETVLKKNIKINKTKKPKYFFKLMFAFFVVFLLSACCSSISDTTIGFLYFDEKNGIRFCMDEKKKECLFVDCLDISNESMNTSNWSADFVIGDGIIPLNSDTSIGKNTNIKTNLTNDFNACLFDRQIYYRGKAKSFYGGPFALRFHYAGVFPKTISINIKILTPLNYSSSHIIGSFGYHLKFWFVPEKDEDLFDFLEIKDLPRETINFSLKVDFSYLIFDKDENGKSVRKYENCIYEYDDQDLPNEPQRLVWFTGPINDIIYDA